MSKIQQLELSTPYSLDEVFACDFGDWILESLSSGIFVEIAPYRVLGGQPIAYFRYKYGCERYSIEYYWLFNVHVADHIKADLSKLASEMSDVRVMRQRGRDVIFLRSSNLFRRQIIFPCGMPP